MICKFRRCSYDQLHHSRQQPAHELHPQQRRHDSPGNHYQDYRAYGTILYFDDTTIVNNMASQFPLYAKNFPIWAQQANGMMQFAVWTALTDLGLGVNLQHYNPLIDDEVKKLTGVPKEWQLIAQMPFGHPTEPPKPIVKVPIEERVKVLQ